MKLSDIPFFGKDKEKETLQLFVKLIQTTRETMDTFKDLMEAVFAKKWGNVKELVQLVKDKETECDQIHHKIQEELFEGAFLPVMRAHLYKLADQLDEVADTIENAANMAEYFRVHTMDKKFIELLKSLVTEADKSVTSLDVVMHSLLDREKMEDFREKFSKMKVAEEACDSLQKEIFDLLYLDKKTHSTLVYLGGNFTHMISGIADNVEYACHTMTAIKLMRHV